MLLTKQQLLTHHAASKDTSRPVLQQIFVREDEGHIVASATDGYVLAEVRERVTPLEDFPVIDGVPHNKIEKGFIPADNAKKMIGHITKNKLLPILNHVLMQQGEIIATDLEKTTRFASREVEGNFPDYKPLIPADAGKGIPINPALLMRGLQVLKDAQDVTIEVGEKKTDPIVLRSDDGDTIITVVVMPLRS